MEKKLILLVGNIGAGKSTLCKEYVEKGYIILCKDSLRYMIGGGHYIFNLDYEESIFKIELYALKQFLKLGCNIVIDSVNIDRRMRKLALKLAKKYNYITIAHILPRLSRKESVDRRMTNPHCQPDRQIWEMVWDKFNKRYQEPTHKEGFNILRYDL